MDYPSGHEETSGSGTSVARADQKRLRGSDDPAVRPGSGIPVDAGMKGLLIVGNLLYLLAAVPALFMFFVATDYSEAANGPVWLLLTAALAWPVALVVSWVLFLWFHRKGADWLGGLLFMTVFGLWVILAFSNPMMA
ncbi:hypothetical protein [Arthrobacter sp. zg-Y750]|uniref:hypothetical protein n=1 Tax=Arthrobacter sp. zg-Y750 TaxID=2894189 RepID=UPI001E3B41C2|nr:hypothetical protein [Arthrobacter sp. zg-Y750]